MQLAHLVSLRLIMVRSRRGRVGSLFLAALLPAAILLSIAAGRLVPPEVAFDLSLVAPTVFLTFALLSLASPLTSGGGQELYPPEQLVAYPIRAGTQYLAALAVLPLNIAWVTQLLFVVSAAFVSLPITWWSLAASLVLAVFVAAVSAWGQVLAWLVTGIRRTAGGRRAMWLVLAAAVVVLTLFLRVIDGKTILDRAPTTSVVVAVLAAGNGDPLSQSPVLVGLILSLVLAVPAGLQACTWAQRRPGDVGAFLNTRSLPRRPDHSVTQHTLDQASIWRSPSLRRGVLVLGVLPGAVAGALQVDWATLIFLPPLVAAGAGLLFGINAFCLDGTGAVWLASLPRDPESAFWAKTRVVAETCLASSCVALIAALLRVEREPSLVELVALVAAVAAGTASVTSACLDFSVRRPHHAELRGQRDTPAPPGSMASYSLRMSLGGTMIALLLAASTASDSWWLPVLVAVPLLCRSALRLLRARDAWEDDFVRARVVKAVAYG